MNVKNLNPVTNHVTIQKAPTIVCAEKDSFWTQTEEVARKLVNKITIDDDWWNIKFLIVSNYSQKQ